MTWRGTTTVSDRIFACLFYLLPLLDLIVLVMGPLRGSFLSPVLDLITIPLLPLIMIYFSNSLIPFAVFFAVYLLVVRNESIRHFIRFNAMQAILFGIVLTLIGLLTGPLVGILPSLFIQTLFNTIFLGTIAAIGFSIVQSAFGRYAEIPTISDAVYMQVR
jgi:Chloroplast import apparatus Tic20-like